ncbi:tyrosine-type recombinase/integrase [Exiguobacterium indicum]|uniref:Tyrosine-type recombinase/integrase n=1 Tax=Exiguobacterium indicum TaxID=296995 RepID=A0ABU8EGP8_9BACL|nr:tyrosine-type recombinase/integrase [Exiguobacterium sp. s161]
MNAHILTQYGLDQNITMKEAIEAFVESLAFQKKSRETIRGYRLSLLDANRYFSERMNGPIRCQDITLHQHIQPYFTYLFQERKLQVASAKRYVSAMRSFFRFLEIQDVVGKDPTARLQLPRVRKTEREHLTQEEFYLLVSCIDIPIVRYVAYVQAFAGLRVSEAIQLTLDDVDLDGRCIRVQHGKGDKARTVPINEELVTELHDYLVHHRHATQSLLFFATKRTGTISIAYINLVLERAKNQAGIDKHVTSHTLRHSYASWLVKNNVNVVYIQKVLGHESVRTTSGYMHVYQEDLQETITKVRFSPEKGETSDE